MAAADGRGYAINNWGSGVVVRKKASEMADSAYMGWSNTSALALAKGGLPTVGVISGFTNTQLGELVNIYRKLNIMTNTEAIKTKGNLTKGTTDLPDDKTTVAYAQAYAKQLMANKYGWTSPKQWEALKQLWTRESGWNYKAVNPSSQAWGIPQSLPGSKMGSMGGDWKTNPDTQIKWGLKYIRDRYGSPQGAWGAWNNKGWYADGGLVIPGLRKGATINYDNTLANLHRGESVLTRPLTNQLKEGVGVASGGDIIYNVDITVKENMSAKQAENLVFNALDRHTAKVGRRR